MWKGAVTFGLVNIPVALYPAIRKEVLKFRMLRKSDLSPIQYKRVAEADGQEVSWEQIVKGHEYEKGKFVVLSEDDFKRVDVAAAQTVHIVDFVELREIDPIHFGTPYYLEPQKGGNKAYLLLRDVLVETGKIGIAKVVIKTKEHLAAVKPNGPFMLLQLMHFAEDIAGTEGLQAPKEEKVDKREMDMAKTLVESMTDEWNPQKYKDDYSIALQQMMERRIKEGEKGRKAPGKTAVASPNVINLLDVLQKSLEGSKGNPRKKKARG